jgi:hypothetical protein
MHHVATPYWRRIEFFRSLFRRPSHHEHHPVTSRMLNKAASGVLKSREASLVKRVSGLKFHVSSLDPQPET